MSFYDIDIQAAVAANLDYVEASFPMGTAAGLGLVLNQNVMGIAIGPGSCCDQVEFNMPLASGGATTSKTAIGPNTPLITNGGGLLLAVGNGGLAGTGDIRLPGAGLRFAQSDIVNAGSFPDIGNVSVLLYLKKPNFLPSGRHDVIVADAISLVGANQVVQAIPAIGRMTWHVAGYATVKAQVTAVRLYGVWYRGGTKLKRLIASTTLDADGYYDFGVLRNMNYSLCQVEADCGTGSDIYPKLRLSDRS